jgi:hypothetical protein
MSDKKNRKSHQTDESKTDKSSATTIAPTPEAEAVPINNFAAAAEAVEAAGGETVPQPEPVKSAARGVLPDKFGNNVKGERICSECGIKESETLAKNPRYSFCKGKCVNCYGKTERKSVKPAEMSVEQIEAKIKYYTDLLTKKSGAQGLPEVNAAENVTIVTDNVTVVQSGANLGAKADELATVNKS